MNAQERIYLENMPEYKLHQKLLRVEAKLIELILTVDPEDGL